jgi:uncharacterized protein
LKEQSAQALRKAERRHVGFFFHKYVISGMKKEDILDVLREDLPVMQQRFGVKQIGLFGSYAKDCPTPTSDIDLPVDMPPDYKNFMEVVLLLEKKINRKLMLSG